MKRIAVLVEDQYQVLEVWYPYFRLREAGFKRADIEKYLHGEPEKGTAPFFLIKKGAVPFLIALPQILIRGVDFAQFA